MFLETLLAARERLTLSYVARDAVTGEPRSPSSVVEALLDLVEPDRADRGRAPPADRPRAGRRWRATRTPAACAVIPAAARERRAAALGASLRRAGGGVAAAPAARRAARRARARRLGEPSPPISTGSRRPACGRTRARAAG